MLRLVDIKKDYYVSSETVNALKGVSIDFRDNEFVSILGPSGCGKTTLLNIIGGLDRYTSGDLIINGVKTKQYRDRDWDIYRNHRIGFIFQSYNLIPHQTILGNVELALTISGINKKERTQRAKEALDKVGLKDQYNKHPNQLSGGQCQRVAIARALVNNPEILLADEPTGALDTQTSIQIMELIKEIAKDRLVIMVTHNPDLATQYSTRIVKLLDGQMISDSNPYHEEEIKAPEELSKEKAKMSFWTSARLSARNLLSKAKRTIIVCLAGSIGIVGVSTVLAISSGVHNYIDDMQDDILSGNPIKIQESGYDLSALMKDSSAADKIGALKIKDGYVNVNSLIEYLAKMNEQKSSIMISNEIDQNYLNFVSQMPKEYYSAMSFGYGLDISNNIYTDFRLNGNSDKKTMSVSSIIEMYTSVLGKTMFSDYSSYITSLEDAFQQAPGSSDYILSQYDMVSGSKVASNANEIMIVVDNNKEITDLLLAELGYYTQDEFLNIAYKVSNDKNYDASKDKFQFSYEELIGKKFTWYNNDSIYTKNNVNPYTPFNYNPYVTDSFDEDKKIELTVSAILMPKKDVKYGCLKRGFYYTEALTKQMIKDSLSSEIVSYLNENEMNGFNSGKVEMTMPSGGKMSIDNGITYKYQFTYEDVTEEATGFVGSGNMMSSMLEMYGMSLPSTKSLTLRNLGGVDMANEISIYPLNFNEKDLVTNYLDQWNGEEDITIGSETYLASLRKKITYQDNIALVISMINTMIDIVTYALIAFTALSLIVSTVMIGIITYVSVVERVKEIGVIRSLGGRKKDVSRLFTAETIILGFFSGLFGIIVTYLLSLIINLILGSLVGVSTIAALPWYQALIMIAISMILTLISGVIPAQAAARKDPVVALRTE